MALSPGEQPRRPPVRWVAVLAVVLACTAAGILVYRHAAFDVYHRYFTETRRPAQFAFSALNAQWSEATLRQRFAGDAVSCHPYPGAPHADRACALAVRSHNGVPTLFIAFFFGGGQLQQVSFNIPWWSLRSAQRQLVTALGPPSALQDRALAPVPLIGWQLPDGAAVFVNRDRGLNPLQWSAIQWFSAEHCRSLGGCFGAAAAPAPPSSAVGGQT